MEASTTVMAIPVQNFGLRNGPLTAIFCHQVRVPGRMVISSSFGNNQPRPRLGWEDACRPSYRVVAAVASAASGSAGRYSSCWFVVAPLSSALLAPISGQLLLDGSRPTLSVCESPRG